MENLSRSFTDLCDERLKNRGNKIMMDMFRNSVHSIRQFCQTEKEAKAVYRFLRNKRVSETDIIRNMSNTCKLACKGQVVLAFQDTTEINVANHKNRIKDDGYIGTTNSNNTTGFGYFLHPSFVVDAYHGQPYGFAFTKVWNRPLEFKNKKERNYGSLPIEEKDSYKWIETSEETKKALKDIVKYTIIIEDREGDIYEQFAKIPDEQTALLIRAKNDRLLSDGSKLFTTLKYSKIAFERVIEIESISSNGKKTKRAVELNVKFKKVIVNKPKKLSKDLPDEIEMYLIEVTEKGKRKDAIQWRLLTTLQVDDQITANNCIEWYSWRWMIEEMFKMLKKEGFNIEASELESAQAIRKLSLMAMEVIIKIFLMRIAYNEPERPIESATCFNEKEIKCLEKVIDKQEGKTEKQKNPYKKKDLKRYVWAIARLGGWKGYEKSRKPGLTTLWKGLIKFAAIFDGWELSEDVSTR